MKGSEVRESFLKYFESKGHRRVASSALVPENDPTLLFSNAGMNQFKNLFLGAEKRDYSRAVTSQKCLRISGKHNDLENVGVTARHHTFFEMLGNFSFGDYFKKEAIQYAWEYLTEALKLPKERLWVTIFEDDDEAGDLWKKHTDVKHDRVLKCGAEDNFWAMGDTGPCGPCSEIHVYLGDDLSAQSEHGFRNTDGLYLEIWNLVFMQFDRAKDGTLVPLPKPSVDTGMGLERVTSVLQKVRSNYDTDFLRPIITRCEELSGFKYDGSSFEERDLKADINYARDVAMRVIADHSRAATFLIGAGVTPGSDGRGYVLRRVIRRAIRHGRNLSFKGPFFKEMAKVVIKEFGRVYPELKERAAVIEEVVHAEEVKFHETLDAGLAILNKEVEKLKNNPQFPGEIAFLLHDTYGFPLDLTQDVLKSSKKTVDIKSFESAMEAQRSRSREDRKSHGIGFSAVSVGGEKTQFLGYENSELESELTHVAHQEGSDVALLFKETPFYAESGGQVGDTGKVLFKDCEIEILDTQKTGEGYFVHYGKVTKGDFSASLKGKKAKLSINATRRDLIKRNHSATHITHAALRKFLGDHVKQAGSRVDDERLRFDYSHFQAVPTSQLREMQQWINEIVRANYPVETKVLPIEEARKTGAVALFGEKYGDLVRVVHIGPDSIEFCGGTHVQRSGDIGAILIDAESGVAAGTRRIECFTGDAVFNAIQRQQDIIFESAKLLKGSESEINSRIEKLFERQRELEKELEIFRQKSAASASDDLLKSKTVSSKGVSYIATKVPPADSETLKSLVDTLRVKLGSGVVALSSDSPDGGVLVAGATADLASKVHVGNVMKQVMQAVGGRGGGRADFAQGGGIPADKLETVLESFKALI